MFLMISGEKKNNFHMDCTTMKKPPSQTLLNYSILSLAVSPELYSIIKCAPPFWYWEWGERLSHLPNFQNKGGGGGGGLTGSQLLGFTKKFDF